MVDRLSAPGMVGAEVDVRPLSGSHTPEEQDLALAPSPTGRRRVVVATDIAESSLTVAGVRAVVDNSVIYVGRSKWLVEGAAEGLVTESAHRI